MKLYDDVIENIQNLILHQDLKQLKTSASWPLTDSSELIFKSEEAYELGGGSNYGLSQILFTSDTNLVKEDEILLLGKDLKDIKEDTSYARIVMVRVKDEELGEGDKLYKNLTRIDYTRYHLYPEGFMLRISQIASKEAVRVSKAAIKKKISFSEIGKLFIDAYHQNPGVEAVKILFITLPEFPFEKLDKEVNKAAGIFKALDHLMNKIQMDCNTCGLKVVCDEVEQMVKEDFKKEE